MTFIIIIFIILGIYLLLDKYFDNKKMLYESFESNIYSIEETNNDNYFEEEKIEKKELNNSYNIPETLSKNISITSKCFSRKQLATFVEFEKFTKKIYLKSKNKIKGEVWITPTHRIKDLPQITLNGFYINNLCVLEKYRKQGIARELMNYVIKKCRDDGTLHLMLQVELNAEATLSVDEHYLVKFYKSLGFSIYEHDSNIVLMFMSL